MFLGSELISLDKPADLKSDRSIHITESVAGSHRFLELPLNPDAFRRRPQISLESVEYRSSSQSVSNDSDQVIPALD